MSLTETSDLPAWPERWHASPGVPPSSTMTTGRSRLPLTPEATALRKSDTGPCWQ